MIIDRGEGVRATFALAPLMTAPGVVITNPDDRRSLRLKLASLILLIENGHDIGQNKPTVDTGQPQRLA